MKEIKAAVKKKGWAWYQGKYDNGSDYVTFQFDTREVVYNTVSGRFIVEEGGDYITEGSTHMDGVKWYDDLLDFIYTPLTEKVA